MDRKLAIYLLARTMWSMYDTVQSAVQFCLQKPINVHNSTLLKNHSSRGYIHLLLFTKVIEYRSGSQITDAVCVLCLYCVCDVRRRALTLQQNITMIKINYTLRGIGVAEVPPPPEVSRKNSKLKNISLLYNKSLAYGSI